MRRFELVEGTSAKFWMAQIEGSTFVVVYGRLGTAGQRKEKVFPAPDGAQKEHDKKVAEKLREGYHEVAADAATQVAPGAKGAAAASAPLPLPPRLHPHAATPASIAQAVEAVTALQAALGARSWVIARAAQRAKQALHAVSGPDAAAAPALQGAVEQLLARVTAPRSSERLPLRHAMALLGQLDSAAFAKAVRETWKGLGPTHPAAPSVAALTQQLELLGDEELALRVGSVLVDAAPSSSPGTAFWRPQWAALAPHVEAFLVRQHTSVKGHLSSVASAHPQLAERTRAMLGA